MRRTVPDPGPVPVPVGGPPVPVVAVGGAGSLSPFPTVGGETPVPTAPSPVHGVGCHSWWGPVGHVVPVVVDLPRATVVPAAPTRWAISA